MWSNNDDGGEVQGGEMMHNNDSGEVQGGEKRFDVGDIFII